MKFKTPFTLAIFCLTMSAALAGGLDDARTALEKGEYQKALDIAAKVPESSKDRLKALCIIGDVEYAQEHWDEAEKAYRGAVAKKAQHVPAMAGLGRALVHRGNLDEASPLLSKAVALDNSSIDAWHGMCELLIARGKPEDLEAARTDLVATMMLDAKDPLTNRMMVEVLLKQNKVDDAEKAAETFVKADKESALSLYLRALVLEKRGSFDKAIDTHLKAVKKDDRFRDAHANLALLLAAATSGDVGGARNEQALVHAQRYVELGGKDTRVKDLIDRLKPPSSPPAK